MKKSNTNKAKSHLAWALITMTAITVIWAQKAAATGAWF